MKKLKLLIATFFAVSLSFAPAALVGATALAQAPSQSQEALCAGASLGTPPTGTVAANCTANNAKAASSVSKIVTLAINIFSWVIGVVAVFAIIFGGFKYITSGGESGGVTSAKNTILYAIIGLIIVALAQIIVRFVLGNVTGQAVNA